MVMALMPAPASTIASAPELPVDVGTLPTPLDLVRSLAQQPPTRTPFAEARFSPMLDRPLLVSGTLGWDGGQRLRRDVTQPYKENTLIANGEVAMTRPGHATRHFSLDRAPQLRALLQSMVAVLSGDPKPIEGLFDARVDGTTASWTLTLTPLQASLRHDLTYLRLDGGNHTLHCLETVEAKGTVSIDLLGPLAARMPTAPTREALTALCRDAR
jgi:hypothetical protein